MSRVDFVIVSLYSDAILNRNADYTVIEHSGLTGKHLTSRLSPFH